MDRLEAAGYVRRERQRTDRRKVTIVPQPLVWQRTSPLFAQIKQERTELCADYTTDELATILDFFTRSRPLLHNQINRLRRRRSG